MESHRTGWDSLAEYELRQHYEVEKQLANRLRTATREERRRLYRQVYDELFQRVPFHPQLTNKASPEQARQAAASQMRLLRRFLSATTTFLEIGAGDCALAIQVAAVARHVYAVDVSAEITQSDRQPDNLSLILSDGTSIPVPPGCVDVAYSYQLMEHLHPEDALEQLRNVYQALAPGGIYLCVTPNRLSGPHDISFFFDREATGFHLKEYTTRELSQLFRSVGFRRLSAYVGGHGRYARWPVGMIGVCERLLERLPFAVRTTIARRLVVHGLLGIRLLGHKPLRPTTHAA